MNKFTCIHSVGALLLLASSFPCIVQAQYNSEKNVISKQQVTGLKEKFWNTFDWKDGENDGANPYEGADVSGVNDIVHNPSAMYFDYQAGTLVCNFDASRIALYNTTGQCLATTTHINAINARMEQGGIYVVVAQDLNGKRYICKVAR